jgi:hypothetical protein
LRIGAGVENQRISVVSVDSQTVFRRRPQRIAPSIDEVAAKIEAHKGFLTPAAMSLGLSRSSLARMVSRSSKLSYACREAREGLLDFAEQKLFQKISDGDVRAITFALSTVGKARGYALAKGTEFNVGETVNNNHLVIQNVTIEAVPSGTMMSETRTRDLVVAGSSALIDHEADTRTIDDL